MLYIEIRTVGRKFSIGGLWVCSGQIDTIKIDKNSTDLECFIFHFEKVWSIVWGAKSPKTPMATGLVETYGKGNLNSFFYFLFFYFRSESLRRKYQSRFVIGRCLRASCNDHKIRQ